MKISVLYLMFLCFILQACTNGNKNRLDKAPGKDTIIINKILNQIEQNEFTSADTCLKYLAKADKLSKQINYIKGITGSSFQMGNELYKLNKYSSAYKQYEDLLKISEKQKDTLLRARCIERMASVTMDMGDDPKALKLYYEALPLFEQTKNKEGIATVFNIIGGNKSSLHEFDSAERYLRKAIQLNEEIGNQSGVIHNKANLAFMYHYMDKNDKAKELYKDIIPKLITTGDSINLSVVYYHYSIFFQWTEQPDSSLIYLQKALNISEKLEDKSFLPTLNGMIGMVLMDEDKYDSALYFLTKSVRLAKDVDDYLTQRQSLQLLLSIDTLKGDYKKATRRYGEILVLNDSVYMQNFRNNMETSELRYENQKKNNFIDIQEVSLESTNRQKHFLLLVFLLSLVLSLLLVSLIILLRRNNKRKQELLTEKLRINELQLENANNTEEISRLRIENTENELRIKEQEQMSHALALEQKNELLRMINSRLKEIMTSVGSIDEITLNSILSSIRMQPNKEDNGNLFNQKFSSLHPSFFDTLRLKHPELTRSELRFCAYLKLNLDRAQVANIHNITTEAIRKTRYRVRKKLGLSPDTSLEDYISRF
jgi:tetratricopeptide (TPR) repeat protein